MRITINKVACDIETSTMEDWSEIREYVAIRKLRLKERKRKAIDLILNERELLQGLLEKNDKELEEELESINKHRVNLDRQGRFWSKVPFIVE